MKAVRLVATGKPLVECDVAATATVPLAADRINNVMDALERLQGASRTVIVP